VKAQKGGDFVAAESAVERQAGPGRRPVEDGFEPIALVDTCGRRQQRLEAIIADCGGKAWCVERPVKGGLSNLQSVSHILLFALDGETDQYGAISSTIQAFRQSGFRIVAFADGLERWPLGSRCFLLLAGASHLLDSAAPAFERNLRQLLREFLKEEKTSEVEDRHTKDVMAGLGMVGASEAMMSVFRSIARIGPLSDLPVLLTGETGTGKELLAHAIHALDPKRCKGPFIPVNCAALSPMLAESELFGHRRGTFTGAERDRKGLIRAAHGGVLFLDEISDLGADLQPKLLRMLQENRVLTLGEEVEAPVSVRVIAATNQDLRAMIDQRKFRADLFQRLNVLPIRVPSLRERPSDVELLARHFLAKHCGLQSDEQIETAPDFLEALARVEFPGNVRQLENLVRQAVVHKKAPTPLSLSDLPPEIWLQLCNHATAAVPQEIHAQSPNRTETIAASQSDTEDLRMWECLLHAHHGNLVSCMQACERSLLSVMLKSAQGNQSQMARVMGITSRSIYSKLRKHGLQTG
jgi:two-component system nitrogen regulation response regulator GlnG